MMDLIHITNETEFKVAQRVLKACDKKPFEIQPTYYGPCYLENKDNYLVLRQYQLPENKNIIPFDQFIKEAI